MKIEKGKLYYNPQLNMVIKAVTDRGHDKSTHCNKIAVHCPTKEDWDYVVSKGYNLIEPHNFYGGFFQIDGNGWCNDDGTWYENENFHIITIDQFKEFYPGYTENNEITNKTSTIIQNKEQTLTEQLNDVMEALEKLKDHVNKIKSRL